MSNEKWRAENIPDLSGKVVIVTGANSGLGFEASKEFARKGAKVIMACRNMDKAQTALAQIREEIPDVLAEVIQRDLASLKSTHQFADSFKAKYRNRLDVLLNNAGIMFGPYVKTEDGFESTFGVDHLGHFALTGLLLDVLKKTPKSRVVNVTSFAHTSGEMDFNDLMFENNGYSPGKAYPRAKLANILFTYELQRRLERNGIDCISVAVNPGFVRTNWIRHMRERSRFQAFFIGIGLRILGQSPARGGLSLLRASVDPEVKGGEYYSPDGRFGGYPVRTESSEASHNEEDAEKLWEVSESLTSVKFTF
jgi:NAD(P)-dependent dehydrogenase (short-subunit alcohol dehydrogenase family)